MYRQTYILAHSYLLGAKDASDLSVWRSVFKDLFEWFQNFGVST